MENKQFIVHKHMPKVLLICTGGTIAMVDSPEGYVTQKDLIKRIRLFKSMYDMHFSTEHGVS